MTDIPQIHPETRILIDGKLVESDSGDTFDVINPATEGVAGHAQDAGPAEMRRAIEAARRAFDETDWSTDRELRKRGLRQLAEALDGARDTMREELIIEAGAPRLLTGGPQLDLPIDDALRVPLELIDTFEWESDLGSATDIQGNPATRRVWREPMGVVGAIVPWNFPVEVTLNKIAQALATGNTVVLKPAPDTPWNATRLGALVAEQTDIPPGVFNVVTSSDHLVGEELTLSPLVDCISFTGSTDVGKRIMEKGAATLKRVFLELGGKSATVVLDDADLGAAAMMGIAVCAHSGQGCAIPTRMLLPRSRYEEGVEILTEVMGMMPIGDPQRDDVLGGPLVNAKQYERVTGYIAKGVEEGATLAVGGGRPDGVGDEGWYVEATMFTDVAPDMTIAQDEIFGPVLCVIAHDGDDDAVRIANDSRYGLAGAVFGSTDRALAVASRIRTGSLSINGAGNYFADLPFGGYKQSGIGRQNGTAGFEQYLETKSLALPGT